MPLADTIGRFIISETRNYGRTMTDKECMGLMTATGIDIEATPEKLEQVHELMSASFLYKVLDARVKAFIPNPVSVPALMFLTTLSDRPGIVVLYAAVLAELAMEIPKGETVTLTHIVNTFPFNVPTEDILEKAWDKQKMVEHEGEKYDNGLDQIWGWQ